MQRTTPSPVLPWRESAGHFPSRPRSEPNLQNIFELQTTFAFGTALVSTALAAQTPALRVAKVHVQPASPPTPPVSPCSLPLTTTSPLPPHPPQPLRPHRNATPPRLPSRFGTSSKTDDWRKQTTDHCSTPRRWRPPRPTTPPRRASSYKVCVSTASGTAKDKNKR
ncbi:hypothetical protein FOCC_FOCC006407 [Frankliniella occidentalis]|nr:hypothetical protein FOCC_FOCC006407 [Frankliniella occidentalis]